MDHLKKVKKQLEKHWLHKKGVASIGVGKVNGQTGIIVSLEKDDGSISSQIPSEMDGVFIKIEISGEHQTF